MPYTRNLGAPPKPAQNLCRALRNRGMILAGGADRVDLDAQRMGSGDCWCNLTQHVVGVDGKMVTLTSCTSERECYQS